MHRGIFVRLLRENQGMWKKISRQASQTLHDCRAVGKDCFIRCLRRLGKRYLSPYLIIANSPTVVGWLVTLPWTASRSATRNPLTVFLIHVPPATSLVPTPAHHMLREVNHCPRCIASRVPCGTGISSTCDHPSSSCYTSVATHRVRAVAGTNIRNPRRSERISPRRVLRPCYILCLFASSHRVYVVRGLCEVVVRRIHDVSAVLLDQDHTYLFMKFCL